MYYDIYGKIPSCSIRFLHEAILNAHKKLVCTVVYRAGGLGCQPPPPEIPKALHNRAKLNPICENC